MNRLPHTLLAIGLSFYILEPEIELFPYILIASALGGMIPDLDRRYRHRKLLHNIPVWIAVTTALLILTQQPYIYVEPQTALAMVKGFMIGVSSHLFVDALTIRGIAPLYPLSSKHVSLLKIRSSSQTFNMAGTIIGVALFVSWIYRSVA